MKKIIILSIVIIVLVMFTGCFIVELILPPLEGGSARMAVYMHYSTINEYAHRISSVELNVESVSFSEKTEPVNKPIVINFRPAQTVNTPSDLVGILSQYQIGQFIFNNEDDDEQEFENPVLDISLSPEATVSYIIEIEDDEEEETTESTDVRFLVEDTDLSAPVKVLTSSFSTKGKLSLPVGQSTLFVLLDFSELSTYEEAASTGTTNSSTAISLGNSFSMMKDDTTVIYGQIEDNTEEEDPALVPGQDWTLDFYDALYLGESNRFSTLSYPLSQEWSSLSNQHYFLMVPRGDYNPGVYLRAPGEEDDDEYSVELDLNNDEESKNAGTLEYPDEGE